MALPTQTIGGLISGFDTSNIIEKLMTIERRPVKLMEQEVAELQAQQEAYRAVSRALLAYKTEVDTLGRLSSYNAKTASSSAESLLTASASDAAAAGSYSFRTVRRAQTEQLVSRGFATSDATAVGAGEIRIDGAGASLRQGTRLAELNGTAGVERGSIRITDRSGASAVIDLSVAETVQDVLDLVNETSGIQVQAELAPGGTRLRLQDLSGGAGDIVVEEVAGMRTAEDLGLLGATSGATHTGGQVYVMQGQSALSWLRDGLGIDDGTLGTVRIEDTGGTATGPFDVDLSAATTVQEVIDAIDADTGGAFTAEVDPTDARRLLIHRTGGDATTNIVVSDDPGDAADTTATDLGIATTGSAGASLTGAYIVGAVDSVLAGTLSGAQATGLDLDGDSVTDDNFTITDRSGASVDVSLAGYKTTLREVLYAINQQTQAAGVDVTAEVNDAGNGIVLRDSSGGSGSLTVADFGDSQTATSLGIAGSVDANELDGADLDRKYIGRGTLLSSLNAGNGVAAGSIAITDAYGQQSVGDLTSLQTVGEVIAAINAASLYVQARVNDTGDGILLENTRFNVFSTSQTGGAIAAPGNTFTDPGKDFTELGVQVGDELVVESGPNAGTYQITAVGTTDLTVGGAGFGSADASVTYQIVSQDAVGTIRVDEVQGGTTAGDLGLLGQASAGEDLDGSFEEVIAIDDNDTLTEVAQKILASDARVQASVLNDGSAFAPYRLTLSSEDAGRAGAVVVDTDIASLGLDQTAAGRDALLLYGAAGGGAAPVLLSSSENTFRNAVPGLTLTVQAAQPDTEVTVTVGREVEEIVTAAEEMVGAYNDLHDLVLQLTQWNEEEEVPGLLFGDSQIANVMREIDDALTNTVSGLDGGISQLYDVGVRFRYDATQRKTSLEFNESTLREKLSTNFESVRDLMTRSVDRALTANYATVSADNPAGGGTSAENLVNGNTASNDFGAANGYEASLALDDPGNADGEDVINLRFDRARPIYQLVLHHIDSTSMPAGDYAIRDFVVEYLDDATGAWEEARTFTGNTAAINYISLPQGTRTSQVRLTVQGTNAADNKTRLVEVEAMERDGVAGRMRTSLSRLTDYATGIFATANDTFNDKIEDLETSIDKANERLEMRQIEYLREFTAMETALAQLQAQSDFFFAQMEALNNQRRLGPNG